MPVTGSNSPIRKTIRNYTANSFIENLKQKDSLFLFVGKTTGWTADAVFDGSEYTAAAGNTAGSSIYLHPADTINEDLKISKNIISMKAINSSDINFMIPRINWAGSTQYVEYDHDAGYRSVSGYGC